MTAPKASLPLPENWSVEQAMAALDMLDLCYDAIWSRYETPIVEHIMHEERQRQLSELQRQADLFTEPPDHDFDDDIPF